MQRSAKLVRTVERHKKTKAVSQLVNARMREFHAFRKTGNRELFSELCFCLLTANFNAERSIKIQSKLRNDFFVLPPTGLAKKLKIIGHRFPNARASYITGAQKYKNKLKQTLSSFTSDHEAREWLVKNVKGLGWKEASHFLRNIGYENVAIVDFHIIDLLKKHNLLDKEISRGALTKNKYLEIERTLSRLAEKTNTSPAELDLYLWYEETGKVLK